MKLPESTTPLWFHDRPETTFPPLSEDTETDVVVIGGGITGVTTAYLLKLGGKKVILLEKGRIGEQDTGHTTSHATEAIDSRYKTLIRDFGEEGARLAAQASRDAMGFIERVQTVEGFQNGSKRLPGFLYSESRDEVDQLRDELEASRRAGVACAWTDDIGLPFPTAGGIRYPDQLQFHPYQHITGLLAKFIGNGCAVYEQTMVNDVKDGEPCIVETERGTIRARHVVVATYSPFNNRFFIHTKIAAYRTYVISAPYPRPLEGLFWDTADPYHYTRTHNVGGREYLIVGGEDHKTGQEEDTEKRFESLLAYTRVRFPISDVAHRWSGQILEPVDGLPYIGRNSLESNVYIATGYAGHGTTFGTIAAILNSDLILGRDNPYAKLLDATRIHPLASAKDWVQENVDFPMHLVSDRLTDADVEATSLEEIKPGEGKIVKCGGRKIAASRDASGVLHTLSPICTHLGCDVAWNDSERSWDCPCHGSRFTPTGEVLNGPAPKALEKVEVSPAKK